MDSSATSASITGQTKNSLKTRRTWTALEEEALIQALKDAVTKGWKSENCFKAGYLQYLEDAMKVVFPGTDIRGNPHINSKIHVWKKTHGSLYTMLSKSGVGWNDTDKVIEATNEAWAEMIKADKNARLMRNKRWPNYQDWCEIFGNDRATGENVETFAAAVNEVLNMTYDAPNNVDPGIEDLFRGAEGAGESNSVSQTPSSAPTPATNKKSRKRIRGIESDDLLITAVNNLADITKNSMNDLIKSLESDSKLTNATDSVLESLANIPELTSDEKVRVAEFMVDHPNKLALFLKLSHEDKVVLSKRVLQL